MPKNLGKLTERVGENGVLVHPFRVDVSDDNYLTAWTDGAVFASRQRFGLTPLQAIAMSTYEARFPLWACFTCGDRKPRCRRCAHDLTYLGDEL